MIFFYNKKTGEIFGSVMGRVHPQEVIDNVFIHPSDMYRKDIGKYIIPYKPIKKTITEQIKELRVVDQKTGKVEEVVIGSRKKEISDGLEPDVPFKDLIYAFEDMIEDAHQYKIIEENNKIKGIVKK